MADLTDTVREQTRDLVTRGTETARGLKHHEKTRDDFPGEHLIVLATGAFLLWGASRRRSMLARMVLAAAGSALVGRAAAGRGGVAKIAGLLGRR